MVKKVGVAILGLGVVGGGTYQTLVEHHDFYLKTQQVDLTVEMLDEMAVYHRINFTYCSFFIYVTLHRGTSLYSYIITKRCRKSRQKSICYCKF